MKATLFVLIALSCTIIGHSQDVNVRSTTIQPEVNGNMISFTTPKEVNVRHYRIEASNDNVHFEVIATIPSKGNNMLPSKYNYDVAAYPYIYYRIGQVDMNGQMPYSSVATNELVAKQHADKDMQLKLATKK